MRGTVVGLREQLSENRVIVATATIGVVVITLVTIVWQRSGSSETATTPPFLAYFTTDDSSPAAAKAALFSDSIDKLPPFEKDGKQAFRAYLFSCDGGRTTWIAYLERYTPQGLKRMQTGDLGEKDRDASPSRVMMMTIPGMTQIKRPGGKQWIDRSDRVNSGAITDVRCPDGSTKDLEIVNP